VVIGTFISDRYIQIACHMKNEKKSEKSCPRLLKKREMKISSNG